MVRKRAKDVSSQLIEITNKFNYTFKDISNITYEFIKEIDTQGSKNFNTLFEEYNLRIREVENLIPQLTKKVREFGIF